MPETDEERILAAIDDSLPADERAGFACRLREDAALRAAFAEQLLLTRLLTGVRRGDVPTMAQRVSEALRAPRSDRPRRLAQAVQRRRRAMHLGRAWWRPAVGVAAAVLLGWGAMWWSASRDGHQALQPAVATTLALRDGSTLAVSAQSRVETREGKSGTEVLLHKGDILCTVASQGSGRSFEVRTAEARCRVVGTRFQVACLEDGTHVRLDEGTLLVSMLASSAGGERLRPGQGAVISTAGLVTSGGMGLFSYGVDTVDPARWSTGINPGSELSWSIQDSRRWHGSSVVVDYHLRPGSDTSMWAVVNHELPKPREVDPLAMGMEVWFQGGGEGLEAWVEVMEVSAAGHEFFQAVFVDDQAGWRRVRLPWFAFERKQEWQPEGAVDDGFQHQCFSAAGVGIRQWQPTTSHRGRFSFAAVGPYR